MHHIEQMLKLNNETSIIHVVNLRLLDLNLLVVFDALMRERNVTRAALAIGLSQPAFSNALTRLRERLGDELFVRTPEGMRPTPWALELSGPVSKALGDIENALDGAAFDPATSSRTFTIAALDYATLVLIPTFLKRMQQEAPGVVIRIHTPSMISGEFLETQQADVALFSWPNPPDRFVSEPLIDEDWVCVMRPDHLLAGAPLAIENYVEAKHLLVSPRGDPHGWVDDALAERGLSRFVSVTMPTFGPAPLTLETTDLILTCPKRVGTVFVSRTGMAMVPCPIPAPPIMRSIDMVWHARLGNHPAQIWLRELLHEVADSTAE